MEKKDLKKKNRMKIIMPYLFKKKIENAKKSEKKENTKKRRIKLSKHKKKIYIKKKKN